MTIELSEYVIDAIADAIVKKMQEPTKEEKALLQKWRDNRGISLKDFEDAMDALEQEPKTGHWIVVSDGYGDNAYICECSECKDTVWVYKDADRKWNFCPNCGAKMGVEE